VEFTLYTYEPVDDLPRLARRGFPAGTYLLTDLDAAATGAMEEEAEGNGQHMILEVRLPEEVLTVPEEDIEDALDEDDGWEEVVEEPGEATQEEIDADAEADAADDIFSQQIAAYEAAAEPYSQQVDDYYQQLRQLYQSGFGQQSPEVIALQEAIDQIQEHIEVLYSQYVPDEPEEPEEPETEIELTEASKEDLDPEELKRIAEFEDPTLREDWPKTLKAAVELTESATLTDRVQGDKFRVLGAPAYAYNEELTPEERRQGVWFRLPQEPVPLMQFKSPFWREFLRMLFFRR
jgi:hypothetical protein